MLCARQSSGCCCKCSVPDPGELLLVVRSGGAVKQVYKTARGRCFEEKQKEGAWGGTRGHCCFLLGVEDSESDTRPDGAGRAAGHL